MLLSSGYDELRCGISLCSPKTINSYKSENGKSGHDDTSNWIRCPMHILYTLRIRFPIQTCTNQISCHISHTHTLTMCLCSQLMSTKCPSSGIVDTWYMYSTHSLSSVLICFVVCELIPIYENIVRNFAVSSYQLNTLLYVCCVVLCRSI